MIVPQYLGDVSAPDNDFSGYKSRSQSGLLSAKVAKNTKNILSGSTLNI
jgi:hypothetical protein